MSFTFSERTLLVLAVLGQNLSLPGRTMFDIEEPVLPKVTDTRIEPDQNRDQIVVCSVMETSC